MTANPYSGHLCPDWVWSNNSNVHVAKDREWFTEYTPFESTLGDIYGMSGGLRVQGVGNVELLTKKSPNMKGKKNHSTVRLTNVVHAPNVLCNIIGAPILKDYNVKHGAKNEVGGILDGQDRSVAYFDPSHPLFSVKLRGPSVGPPAIRQGDLVMVNAFWSGEERERWQRHERGHHIPPLTAAERAWLKANYGNEVKFLQAFGLSIYKDDDREEGRRILSGFMREKGRRRKKNKKTKRKLAQNS